MGGPTIYIYIYIYIYMYIYVYAHLPIVYLSTIKGWTNDRQAGSKV